MTRDTEINTNEEDNYNYDNEVKLPFPFEEWKLGKPEESHEDFINSLPQKKQKEQKISKEPRYINRIDGCLALTRSALLEHNSGTSQLEILKEKPIRVELEINGENKEVYLDNIIFPDDSFAIEESSSGIKIYNDVLSPIEGNSRLSKDFNIYSDKLRTHYEVQAIWHVLSQLNQNLFSKRDNFQEIELAQILQPFLRMQYEIGSTERVLELIQRFNIFFSTSSSKETITALKYAQGYYRNQHFMETEVEKILTSINLYSQRIKEIGNKKIETEEERKIYSNTFNTILDLMGKYPNWNKLNRIKRFMAYTSFLRENGQSLILSEIELHKFIEDNTKELNESYRNIRNLQVNTIPEYLGNSSHHLKKGHINHSPNIPTHPQGKVI